ncbi:MAG: hypothetical protein U0T36_11920 [Saprospiraceae bacterium]
MLKVSKVSWSSCREYGCQWQDGTVKTVFADCNPSGIDTYAFKNQQSKNLHMIFFTRRIHQKLHPR